jgi:hypothetical protein
MREFFRALTTAVLMGMAAGALVIVFQVVQGPPPVRDVPAVPLEDTTPAPWTPPVAPVAPSIPDAPASIPDGEQANPVQVVPVAPASEVRPPLEFPTHTPAPEIDYREGRIMEPLEDDGQERERAYARCRGGYDATPTADQAAYCERYYGPESGYQPGD